MTSLECKKMIKTFELSDSDKNWQTHIETKLQYEIILKKHNRQKENGSILNGKQMNLLGSSLIQHIRFYSYTTFLW